MKGAIGQVGNEGSYFTALASHNGAKTQQLATLPSCVTYFPVHLFGCTPIAELTQSQKAKLDSV